MRKRSYPAGDFVVINRAKLTSKMGIFQIKTKPLIFSAAFVSAGMLMAYLKYVLNK